MKSTGSTVIDDYGHHPVEIRAVLAAAREGVGTGRVIAVVQPHRFTRLRDHMADFEAAFNDADMVYAAPVYAAGEAPIEGVDSAAMVKGMKARGHRNRRRLLPGQTRWPMPWPIRSSRAIWWSALARAISPNGRRAWPMRLRRGGAA